MEEWKGKKLVSNYTRIYATSKRDCFTSKDSILKTFGTDRSIRLYEQLYYTAGMSVKFDPKTYEKE